MITTGRFGRQARRPVIQALCLLSGAAWLKSHPPGRLTVRRIALSHQSSPDSANADSAFEDPRHLASPDIALCNMCPLKRQPNSEPSQPGRAGTGGVGRPASGVYAISSLAPADLERTVLIPGEAHTVVEAIGRQVTHYAAHASQVVLQAKHDASVGWRTLSLPPRQPKGSQRRPWPRSRGAARNGYRRLRRLSEPDRGR